MQLGLRVCELTSDTVGAAFVLCQPVKCEVITTIWAADDALHALSISMGPQVFANKSNAAMRTINREQVPGVTMTVFNPLCE